MADKKKWVYSSIMTVLAVCMISISIYAFTLPHLVASHQTVHVGSGNQNGHGRGYNNQNCESDNGCEVNQNHENGRHGNGNGNGNGNGICR